MLWSARCRSGSESRSSSGPSVGIRVRKTIRSCRSSPVPVGGQPAWRTLRLVTAQVTGAALIAALIGTGLPSIASPGKDYVPVHMLAEGLASFVMLLVALGVAHRQDAYVPLALGGMASASVWMTGRGTLGNPVISVPVLILATGMPHPADVLSIVGAQVLGAAVAVAVAAFLFPWARQSAAVLLFRPRQE